MFLKLVGVYCGIARIIVLINIYDAGVNWTEQNFSSYKISILMLPNVYDIWSKFKVCVIFVMKAITNTMVIVQRCMYSLVQSHTYILLRDLILLSLLHVVHVSILNFVLKQIRINELVIGLFVYNFTHIHTHVGLKVKTAQYNYHILKYKQTLSLFYAHEKKLCQFCQ